MRNNTIRRGACLRPCFSMSLPQPLSIRQPLSRVLRCGLILFCVWGCLAGVEAQTPVLGVYTDATLMLGQNATVTPSAAPVGANSAVAMTNTNFTGVLSVNPATGVVTVTNAQQTGVYMVTVTAFNATGSSTASFNLTVTDPNCSPANFVGSAEVGVGVVPDVLAIGDFNGDGKQDFVVANQTDDNVSVHLGDGAGGFSGPVTFATGDTPSSVTVGDLNGDGKQDFVVPNRANNNVSIFLGNGTGGFSNAPAVAADFAPNFVAIGDFNEDGRPDMAISNFYSNNVSIRLGDGTGAFSGTTQLPVNTGPGFVATGDFNGDDHQDLAVVNTISNNVSILLGDGTGAFSGIAAVAPGNQLFSLAIGDFNEDGIQDLAVPNLGSNNVAIRLGDGSGGFGGTTMIAVGSRPFSTSIGDLNGDGHQDLAAVNINTDNVSIRFGDGTGNFGGTTDVSVGDLPHFMAIGDFNGDGRQDFAVANLLSNTVSIRLNVANEVNVQGNSAIIADGDNTPSLSDHTDFGFLNIGNSVTRTFTIQNTGTASLTVNSIGSSNPEFVVGGITLPATLAANGTATFTVAFTATDAGVQSATLTVNNDDCDEALYDFAIRAQVNCISPNIVCPNNQSANTAAGLCTAVVNYPAPTVTGAPAPAVTYVFSGATTGNGSGTGSGSTFNKGTTTVALTATSTCGSSSCTFTVTVMDNQPPVVSCKQATVVITELSVALSPEDVFLSGSDNCGAVTPVSVSPNSFGTTQLGQRTVVLTATDESGNTATCLASVQVNRKLTGRVIWKQDNTTGIKDATITLSGDQSGSMTTAADGNYQFTLSSGANFTLTPDKNLNKMNGINAQDVQRLQQHLSGNPLTSPWQLIAADVNANNAITSLDVSILQQALLGNPSVLAQMPKSWRFVPTSQVLNNPPWGFPEQIQVGPTTVNVDFYGVKAGDVAAAYANPANFEAQPLVLSAPDQVLEAGKVLTVELHAGALRDLNALQFALHFDPEVLQLIDLESAGALPLASEHLGAWQAAEGSLRVLWSDVQSRGLTAGAPLLRLRFAVVEGGLPLSEALQLDDSALPGLVFTGAGVQAGVTLRYDAVTATQQPAVAGLSLQNYPNPFVGHTVLAFELPQACEAQLRITDASGRLIAEYRAEYSAGRHEMPLDLSVSAGVLYCELKTPFGVLSRKMVAVE